MAEELLILSVFEGRALMDNIWLIVGLCFFAVGAGALFLRARRLSTIYNAWTTRLRQRHPSFNPPPTPEMRELNTKIMTWLFRFMGAFFFLLSIVAMIGVLGSN